MSNVYTSLRIDPNHFPESEENTAFSMNVLIYISEAIATNPSFALTPINYGASRVIGSQAQQITQQPVEFPPHARLIECRVRDLMILKSPDTTDGIAMAFTPDLQKHSDPGNHHQLWCCVSPGDEAIPHTVISTAVNKAVLWL
jgi:hypothetical protein